MCNLLEMQDLRPQAQGIRICILTRFPVTQVHTKVSKAVS